MHLTFIKNNLKKVQLLKQNKLLASSIANAVINMYKSHPQRLINLDIIKRKECRIRDLYKTFTLNYTFIIEGSKYKKKSDN